MTNDSSNKTLDSNFQEEDDLASTLSIPLSEARSKLGVLNAEQRLSWALEEFDSDFALTTSFGIQSAVLLNMLHLLPGGASIPVIWVDTGYLPNETYCYAEKLLEKLNAEKESLNPLVIKINKESVFSIL